jgi:hypothetical protein
VTPCPGDEAARASLVARGEGVILEAEAGRWKRLQRQALTVRLNGLEVAPPVNEAGPMVMLDVLEAYAAATDAKAPLANHNKLYAWDYAGNMFDTAMPFVVPRDYTTREKNFPDLPDIQDLPAVKLYPMAPGGTYHALNGLLSRKIPGGHNGAGALLSGTPRTLRPFALLSSPSQFVPLRRAQARRTT